MTEDTVGLSDREKELRRWNAPYAYREFPKMLYRGWVSAGRVELEQRVVGSAAEEAAATGLGWGPDPEQARAVEAARLADLGTAAAERAWADRHMSAPAQAEAAAVERETLAHLPEIPARPTRKR
jgi:hypothetical protein